MQSSLPFLYHPTTILFVGNDQEFQTSISTLLSEFNFIFEENPVSALEILKESCTKEGFFDRCFHHPEEVRYENFMISVNVPEIHKEIYDTSRFDSISIVIVDYATFGSHGIEFLQDMSVKKVLLIDENDEDIAVDALNQGIIDSYIKKQQSVSVTKNTIKKLQEAYFYDISTPIEAIFCPEDRLKSIFYCSQFKNYFNIIKERHSIVEFYLLEKSGASLLCLDANGNHGVLTVYSYEDLHTILESQEATSASPEIIDSLKKGSHTLFYRESAESCLPSGHLWEDYLFKAEPFQNKNGTFFCSYVPDRFDVSKEKVKTYAQSIS
jgi:hypothetical protein